MVGTWQRAVTRAVGVGAAGVLGVAWMLPAHAAETEKTAAAPYSAGDHSTHTSCGAMSVAPRCAASSTADRKAGALAASASADSGLGGTVPGPATSEGLAELGQTIPIGSATAATFTVHLQVTRATTSATGSGRSFDVFTASAACDRCATPDEQYVFPSGPESDTLVVTLVRGTAGAPNAVLTLTAFAHGDIGCDDFCIAPSGTASAAEQAVITKVDVKLWGVGRPTTPVIASPVSGANVGASTFEAQCQVGCQTVSGERITGTAEPGMPVMVEDAGRTIGTAQAGADGTWALVTSLAAGAHTIDAVATGPGGSTAAAPVRFTVG